MTMLKPRSGMRLTVEEFMGLPDTDDRRKMELDEGVLYIMPRPRRVHGFFQLKLAFPVDQYLDSFDEPPAELMMRFIVALSLEAVFCWRRTCASSCEEIRLSSLTAW